VDLLWNCCEFLIRHSRLWYNHIYAERNVKLQLTNSYDIRFVVDVLWICSTARCRAYKTSTTRCSRRRQTSPPAATRQTRRNTCVVCPWFWPIPCIIWKHDVIHKTGIYNVSFPRFWRYINLYVCKLMYAVLQTHSQQVCFWHDLHLHLIVNWTV